MLLTQAEGTVFAQTPPTPPPCPSGFGWSEGLSAYLDASTKMPTDDTKDKNTPDCAFHQWSWETFVWATALKDGVPRFMIFPTQPDLLDSSYNIDKAVVKTLRLGARVSTSVRYEGAGAIVEADGNMLVAQTAILFMLRCT